MFFTRDLRPNPILPPHGAPVNGIEKLGILAPVFLNLDEQFQEDFVPHHLFDFIARECPNLLERGSSGADNDRLLAIAFDIDGGGDFGDL